jgi:peptidyl-prolyl cis-trans isomerase B (cyclophilin B)
MSDVIVTFETTKGNIRLKLFTEQTPLTCANIINLISRGFYDGLNFHRVIADFMVQGGCPQGTGTGGPGYKFEDEFVAELKHDKGGVFSMANSGPGTNGSQFFITHLPTPWLDNNHTVFGGVVDDQDMAVVNSIVQGDKINKATLEGDYKAVLEANKDKVNAWNAVLD